MSNHRAYLASAILLTSVSAGCVDGFLTRSDDQALSGAIFTSDQDGEPVNQNIYEHKEDVYLDGGPGEGPPPGAAALPEGDYYFMVTDPSGMTLLSSDDISCRSFHVSADGVITEAYAGDGGCMHSTGTDQDYDELGAITVQLMPYADTPNPGGEYKVWVTPVAEYSPGSGKYGFLSQHSKTDNFKVIASDEEPPPPPPTCPNGVVDDGEQCDDGNSSDGDGCSSDCTIEVPPPPPPVCGDGVVDAGEECDDGDDDDTDSCSNECTIQT